MTNFVGYSEFYHDAAIAKIDQDGNVLFASQAERYSKKKNDSQIPDELWEAVVEDGDHISFYEDIALKKETREGKEQSTSTDRGRTNSVTAQSEIPLAEAVACDVFYTHHLSHVATAFFTRPWDSVDDTVMVSIDGVGELQTATIYNSKFELVWDMHWPKSVGLPYTSVTKDLGLRPLEDEYVVMGLSSYGRDTHSSIFLDYWNHTEDQDQFYLKGMPADDMNNIRYQRWTKTRGAMKDLAKHNTKAISRENLAKSVQVFAEKAIMDIMHEARKYGSKLVYSGGCAQNVVVNSYLTELFDDVHIAIAPTDAGSALGCAALSWHKATGGTKLNWSPYCGHEIKGELDPVEVVDYLMEHKVCGIANGKAEFGPRALGNRSLIADVRYDVKDTVNEIKRRQKYRPFAPAILEEHVEEYFDGPTNEYMQFTSKALHDFKSVTHVDGTARVQVLKKDCPSVFRKIVEEYYKRTGIPMLLNTSLNIRGRPMVNDEHDARLFETKYGVKVFTKS